MKDGLTGHMAAAMVGLLALVGSASVDAEDFRWEGRLSQSQAVEIKGGTVDRRAKGRWPCPVHGGLQRRGRGCRCRGRRD